MVVRELELSGQDQMDDATAKKMAERVGYSTSPTYVQGIFIRWRAWKGQQAPSVVTGAFNQSSDAQAEHRRLLLAPLISLREIHPLGFQDYDLAVWFSRPEEPSWPIPKGRAWRRGEGLLEIQLDLEGQPQYPYLRQHLAGDQLWSDLEAGKEALAGDLLARWALLQEIISQMERGQGEGGLGLPVIPDMSYSSGDELAVSLYYAFAIHRQILARCLRLAHQDLRPEAFGQEKPSLTYLGNYPVISGSDDVVHQRGVEFFLRTQAEWSDFPETLEAAGAFRRAEQACGVIQGHIDRSQLAVSFPEGSYCDGCR